MNRFRINFANQEGKTPLGCLLSVTIFFVIAGLLLGGIASLFFDPEYNGVPYVEKDGKRYPNLVRLPDEGKIAGVCSGLGYYFGIDPWKVRICFIVVTFVGGSGICAYLILWYLMDSAHTPDDYLGRINPGS